MPPSKRGGRGSKSQEERDLIQTRKRLDKEARQALRRANKDVRQYRHEVAALKKAGVLSKRVNARSQRVTKYMLRMTRRYEDIVRGEVLAVKAAKVDPGYYEKGLFEKRGRFLIVPKTDKNMRAKVLKGKIATFRRLGEGEERKIFLPYTATDMPALVERLKNDPNLDGLKAADEQFAFQLLGHNALMGFVDADELIEFIERRYAHLFSGTVGHKAVKSFTLWRFKHDLGRLQTEAAESEKFFNEGKRRRRRGPPGVIEQQRMERDRIRKEQERDRETPERYQERLAKQREISRRNRQERYAAKIEKLSGLD